MTQTFGVNESNPLGLNLVESPLLAQSSLVHQASVTLTDDQIKTLPSVGFALTGVPGLNRMIAFQSGTTWAQGLINASGQWTSAYSGTADGDYYRFGYGDFDEDASVNGEPNIFQGSRASDWFIARFQLSTITGLSNYGEAYFAGQNRVMNKPLALLANVAGGDLTGGDPRNTLLVTALFQVIDLTAARYLTVAESGWNEASRQFYPPSYPQP